MERDAASLEPSQMEANCPSPSSLSQSVCSLGEVAPVPRHSLRFTLEHKWPMISPGSEDLGTRAFGYMSCIDTEVGETVSEPSDFRNSVSFPPCPHDREFGPIPYGRAPSRRMR